MSGPQIYLTKPIFSWIPEPLPRTLPVPANEGSFRAPFGIDPWLYHAVLRPEVPFVFASLYVVTVVSLNAYNKSRGHKPWWIARQSFFPALVVLHNISLAIYSLATFLALFRAAAHTIPSLSSDTSLAEYADSLCKMHGPRGFGDAAAFNTTINIWEAKNSLIKLGYDGNPDPTDVGRLWNEGLAFWGWFFYLSKFYEVIDTLIILAKGKRSATLQTYHHSGAMLCMWAGIRYMSPPIWMFVFVNSLIHTLMYTYYTLSALNVKVPQSLKRTLTTLQIIQILWGVTYAGAHLFIKYDIPVTTSYQVVSFLQSAASSVASVASAATAAVTDVFESPAAPSGTLVALAKKLLLRAVGEEGIAERVVNQKGELLSPKIAEKIEEFNHQTEVYETRWRTDFNKVSCIDTTGEAFAIYFNLLYLFPLAFLFFRFFVTAYLRRGKPRSTTKKTAQIKQSIDEAEQKTEATIEKKGNELEGKLQQIDSGNVQEQVLKDVQALKDGTWERVQKVGGQLQSIERQVVEQGEKLVGSIVDSVKSVSTQNAEANESLPSLANGANANPDADATSGTASQMALQQESDVKQDENLLATQNVRPGTDVVHETKEVVLTPSDAPASAADESTGNLLQSAVPLTESQSSFKESEGGEPLEFSTTSFSSDFADYVASSAKKFADSIEQSIAGEGSLDGEDKPDFPRSREDTSGS